jgi:exosortase A-associated hydrolase 1
MRLLLSFPCEGALVGASLDAADGGTGVLIVTGGTQTRIGSHRIFERLGRALAGAGHPCFRFDRRGVGDSEGEDKDFRGNASDINAAVASFREQCPGVERVFGFGLCDGATSLALHGAAAGLAGLILVNPWLVEAESGAPAAAAIKHHYRRRLLSLEGWKKILTGSISYKKLLKGIVKVAADRGPGGLAGEAADGLAAAALSVELILARDDATAVAAANAWHASDFAKRIAALPVHVTTIESDSHTFARPGDAEALRDACLDAIARVDGSGGR